MKRNRHHGLNVEFDGLCIDFGHVSLNKKKEFLCGDCYKIEENDKENKMILCIMKDITKERKHKDQIHNAQIEAARMADKLVEEQLKIVQQIAGLLGETAADTKVAVEKLKNTILLESEEENEKK